MSKKSNGLGKFVLGGALGAGLALLFAPKKGEELRKDLKKQLDKLIDKAKDIDVEEVTKEFNKKVEDLKEELKDKAEDLYCLAKEKGTPVLEGIAKDVKKSTASVIREVLKKLESE